MRLEQLLSEVVDKVSADFNSIKVRLELRRFVRISIELPIFQFHKGAIRTASGDGGWMIPPRFQFHKGAIRTTTTDNAFEGTPVFQFHKGAIRTLLIMPLRELLYFNSIKVRLELYFIDEVVDSYAKFQFHKGAIRTKDTSGCILVGKRFQFHKGAIRTNVQSILIVSVSLFQFHKGAIRTFV